MDEFQFNAAGLREFQIIVGRVVDSVADQAAKEMVRRVPRGTGEHLADHIKTTSNRSSKGHYAEIGTDSRRFFYWLFLERGTERMGARLFIRPALDHTYTV